MEGKPRRSAAQGFIVAIKLKIPRAKAPAKGGRTSSRGRSQPFQPVRSGGAGCRHFFPGGDAGRAGRLHPLLRQVRQDHRPPPARPDVQQRRPESTPVRPASGWARALLRKKSPPSCAVPATLTPTSPTVSAATGWLNARHRNPSRSRVVPQPGRRGGARKRRQDRAHCRHRRLRRPRSFRLRAGAHADHRGGHRAALQAPAGGLQRHPQGAGGRGDLHRRPPLLPAQRRQLLALHAGGVG